MIEAKDLRIGNLIYFTKDHPVSEVTQIFKKGVNVNTTDGMCPYVLIEPIKLTEKWLINFGFKECEPSRYGHKYTIGRADWGFTIENSFEKETWFFGHEHYDSGNEDENNKSMHFCFDLKYVHQLQNIFYSLTDEELQTQAGGV